jgi:hypothetical protein
MSPDDYATVRRHARSRAAQSSGCGPPKRRPRFAGGASRLTDNARTAYLPGIIRQPCFAETPLGRWLNRERRLAKLARENATKEKAGMSR